MKLAQIKLALREGLPFQITTAAGDKFTVSQVHHIAYTGDRTTWVTVIDQDLAHIVPLEAMTSITYLGPETPGRRKRAT